MSHLGYGPSLADQGYSPDDIEEPERWRCTNCGAFLAYPSTMTVRYGYPGQEITEERWGAVCRKCGSTNYEGI